MSPNTFFAVCLFAGVLVALVAGQSLDMQSCSKNARLHVDRYRDSVTKALRKFSDSMQQSADQVMDTSAIQSDIDKMTESVSSLTNMSGGIDMGRLTSVYMENLQTMANIGRNSFRPQLLMGGMNSYMEFLNSLTTCNTDLMKAIAQACMPSSRV